MTGLVQTACITMHSNTNAIAGTRMMNVSVPWFPPIGPLQGRRVGFVWVDVYNLTNIRFNLKLHTIWYTLAPLLQLATTIQPKLYNPISSTLVGLIGLIASLCSYLLNIISNSPISNSPICTAEHIQQVINYLTRIVQTAQPKHRSHSRDAACNAMVDTSPFRHPCCISIGYFDVQGFYDYLPSNIRKCRENVDLGSYSGVYVRVIFAAALLHQFWSV